MLVNNNPQAVSTIEKLKRTDMDPANAAASTLYSGAVQAAQQTVTVPDGSPRNDAHLLVLIFWQFMVNELLTARNALHCALQIPGRHGLAPYARLA